MGRCTLVAAIAFLAWRPAVAAESPQESKELAAIRATVESYTAAYNRGDAKAVADHWGDNAEWVSPSGERAVGRKAIAKAMEDLFAQNKGVTIDVVDPKVRLVTPEVALEEGAVVVHTPGLPASNATYLAVHVKRGGRWQLESVRETEVPDTQPAHDKLQQLDWLIGDWVDGGPAGVVETTVQWAKNKNFLTANFRVSVPDADDLEGVQVIGWDPKNETIRSWMFDSDGGFGEGVWSQKGDHWVVKFTQTLSDGRTASATNIYRPIDADRYGWQSVGRKVEGEFAPNIDEVTVVRKGAEAATPVKKKTTVKANDKKAGQSKKAAKAAGGGS